MKVNLSQNSNEYSTLLIQIGSILNIILCFAAMELVF